MMLHYQEALQKVLAAAPQLGIEELSLHAAGGRSLGADVIAPIDHPLFDQSAVDGYALRFDDLADGSPLLVADHIQAGDAGDRLLLPKTCSRIFTGAPVPPGADTVVMQELTTRAGDLVQVRDAGLRRGGNVRPAGEQIRAGDLGLPKGSQLNPAAIGFLASLGIQKVPVAPLPRVRIIVTGDEFAEDLQDLQRGKIYESNGQMLVAAFAKLGIAATYQTCKDHAETLSGMVAGAIDQCELLILTGGVSVGDYDFSRGALVTNGFEVVFHEVAQKPGKPLLFCQRAQQLAFGLPGNPRAVLMCYYLYVLPLLGHMLGTAQVALPRLQLPLAHDYRRKGDGKTHFVTGKLVGNAISLLDGQQSHMLQSLALADVIVVIGADVDAAVAGTNMDCFLLR
jgi:molybdopterin molybdotransferase